MHQKGLGGKHAGAARQRRRRYIYYHRPSTLGPGRGKTMKLAALKRRPPALRERRAESSISIEARPGAKRAVAPRDPAAEVNILIIDPGPTAEVDRVGAHMVRMSLAAEVTPLRRRAAHLPRLVVVRP